jgi:hypothetical protein
MGGKPVWLMPQLYPPSYWSCVPEEELSRRDMRQACYAGLLGGAKGILMYHWGVLPFAWTRNDDGNKVSVEVEPRVHEQRIGNVKSVVDELKTLGPVVTDGRPADDIVVRWLPSDAGGPSPQVWRVWDYDGMRYLMVLNFLDVPVEGEVLGVNAGINAYAYDASVFAGAGDVSMVPPERPGEARFRVAPRGAGVIELQRRPIPPPE